MAPRRPVPGRDRVLSRALILRRYEDAAGRRIEREVVAIRRALVDLIRAQPPEAVSPGRRARRLEAIATKADAVLKAGYERIHAVVREDLLSLAAVEAGEAVSTMKGIARAEVGIDLTTLRLPTRSQLRAIITTQPVEGWVMRDYWKSQAREIRDRFTAAVRTGMLQSESIDQLVERVRGSRLPDGRYRGGVMSVANRNAQAMVRTAVNEIANTAAFHTYRENADLTEEFEYVTIDDERRTEICEDLDGNRYRYDDPGARRPPQHWNCRSTIVPVVKIAKLREMAAAR